jgi:hypothetical protein
VVGAAAGAAWVTVDMGAGNVRLSVGTRKLRGRGVASEA